MNWFGKKPLPETTHLGAENPPSVAFLGFCDRIHEISDGNPANWGLHLLGVSQQRVLLTFPLNLRGTGLIVALFNPVNEREFKFKFQSQESSDSFEFSLTYRIEVVDGMGAKTTEGEIPKIGWKLLAIPLDTDVVVMSPGLYNVYLDSLPSPSLIGYAYLLFATTPPLTPEDIAAIESDPLAIKVVRAVISCNSCGTSFKAYAGLQKSSSLEEDGFQWSATLPETQFRCSCRNVVFDQQYMRLGLHGLLRRQLTPATAEGVTASRLYETTVLESMCRNFLQMINEDSREELVQKFLENNKIFFHTFLPTKLFIKPKLLTFFVADFAVLNERNELLLIEIERPQIRLLKNDLGKSAEFEHAFHQVRSWLQVIDDHRSAVLATWGLELKQVASVKGVVICGRTPTSSDQIRALRSLSETRTDFYTFDDLLNGVAELVRHIANV